MKTEIWPVIHVSQIQPDLAYSNADMAFEAGCEGVFLIQMEQQDQILDPIGEAIKAKWPDKKLGVNYLSLNAWESYRRIEERLYYDACWVDNSGIRSDGMDQIAEWVRHWQSICRPILYFAGVGFKYQKVDPNPEIAAELALRYDRDTIPTTSGTATGKAPPESKLKTIRDYIGEGWRLGVASGVTPENVGVISKYVTHILVSTGISKTFYEFDKEKLEKLIRNCNESET